MSPGEDATPGTRAARPKVWRWCTAPGHGWYSEVDGGGDGFKGTRCDKCKMESALGGMGLGEGAAGQQGGGRA